MSRHESMVKRCLTALVGLAVVGMAALRVSAATWVGAVGSFTNGVHWDTGQVPAGGAAAVIDNGGTACFDGGTASVGAFGLGSGAGTSGAFEMTAGVFSNVTFRAGTGVAAEGSVVQSGGSIVQQGPSVEATVSIGYATNSIGNYTLSGGALTANNGSFHVGSYGTGTLVQTGGAVTGKNWMVVARYLGSAGDYTLAGGVLEQVSSGQGVVVGEQGTGALTVSQGGTANIAGSLAISGGSSVGNWQGTGIVNLCTGGTINTPIVKRNLGLNATFNFDGGTLRARGENATLDTFMEDLTAANVLAGGAVIDSGNNDVTIRQSLNDGGGAGGLVKTGAGALTLGGTNTYAGQTVVNEGFLSALTPDALPGYGQSGRIEVASGAGLAVGAGAWDETDIGTLLERAVFGEDSFFGFDTSAGDAVIEADLIWPFGFLKTGANTLKLTGGNSWTGGTRVRGGTLQADFGTGLSSSTSVTLDGGTLSSESGAITAALGTGAGQLCAVSNRPAGFSAVGVPLTVNLGGAGETLAWGTALFNPAPLLLNDFGADRPLVFANGLDLKGAAREISVHATTSDSTATVTGAVTDSAGGGGLTKTGAGSLTLAGANVFPGTLQVNAGTLALTSPNNNVGQVNIRDGGSLEVDGAIVRQTSGNILAGDGGKGSLNVYGGELRGTGALTMGQKAGSSGTLLLTDGTVDCRLLCVGFHGTGTVVQTGGTLCLSSLGAGGNDGWRVGWNGSGVGTYTLAGGTLDTGAANFQLGYNGRGTLLQTGGTLNSGSWPVVGRGIGGVGVYTLSGGVFNQTSASQRLVVGEQGCGTFTVEGSGVANLSGGLWFGSGDNRGTGIVNLVTSGTINTPTVYRNSNNTTPSFFTFDGGTLRASGPSATLPSFMYGLTSATIKEGGARIDSNGKTITVAQNLTGSDLPPALRHFPPALRHRWSFNGDLGDSAGGQAATAVGAVSTDGRQYTLAGGARGTSYLSLGNDILPTDLPVTVEIWATQRSVNHWGRIFNFGSDMANFIFMAWTQGTALATDRVEVQRSGVSTKIDNSMQPYTLNTEYHISLVITPGGGPDGKTLFQWYKMDAAGNTLKSGSMSAAFDLSALAQTNMWLGHSEHPDNDANASYNEVRIWDAAFTEAQLQESARQGPDVTMRDGGLIKLGDGSLVLAGANIWNGPTIISAGELRAATAGALPAETCLTLAAGGVLNLGSTSQTVAGLSGNGTVSNGTLTVTGAIEPDGTLTLGTGTALAGTLRVDTAPGGTGDRLAATGNLDLSGLTLEVRNLASLNPREVHVIAACAPGGLTGTFTATNLAEAPRWKIRYDNARGEVRLLTGGLVFLLQ